MENTSEEVAARVSEKRKFHAQYRCLLCGWRCKTLSRLTVQLQIELVFFIVFVSSYFSGTCCEKPENIPTLLQASNILVAFMELKLNTLRKSH
jgi:hypothetical protein